LYFCQDFDPRHFRLAETIPGPGTAFFSTIAKELDIVLVTSLFEKVIDGLYHNTAVVLERNGEIAGIYRKMHIPDDPGFYEKYYFRPGDLGFKPIDTSIGRLGVLVCWDQWFPEAARSMALAGAEILLYPTAIGWEPNEEVHEKERQLNAWLTVQRGHAVANHLPVMAANRTGHEPDPSAELDGIDFWGNSFIAGPQGEILAQADELGEGFLMAEIDLERTHKLRHVWPYFRDRRTDAYVLS
jgi:N-carbamoylputrescine amidase